MAVIIHDNNNIARTIATVGGSGGGGGGTDAESIRGFDVATSTPQVGQVLKYHSATDSEGSPTLELRPSLDDGGLVRVTGTGSFTIPQGGHVHISNTEIYLNASAVEQQAQIGVTQFTIANNWHRLPTDIGNLSNVVFTSPTSGNILSYNGTNWINSPAPSGAYVAGTGLGEVEAADNVNLTGNLSVVGNISTGSGNSSLTITAAEELYATLDSLATNAIVATADIPSAFSSAALVQSRTLTQGGTTTLYYSVYNTGFTTDTLYISTDLTNAIYTKTLQ